MNFIGMDVHVRNSYFHITNQDGQVLKKGRCSNSPAALQEFLRGLPSEPACVALENTTNARALAVWLKQYARQTNAEWAVDVLDARQLRIIAESVCKCDRLDAAVLNELSRCNLKLPVCYVADDEVFALREHLRARSDLVRQRTMLKNRVHALLHRRGILTPASDLFTVAGRRFLEQLQLDEAGRTILQHYQHLIEQLQEILAESKQALKELQRRSRWSKPAALLQTMPGIGLITALTILAELGDLSRFKSRAAVSNYAGLVPVIRDSNEKHYHGGISKRGSTHLRAVLTEAAWTAVNRVPVYQNVFEKIAVKKNKAVAIVAVARRMLEDSWTMLKREEAFRYVAGRGGINPASALVSSVAG